MHELSVCFDLLRQVERLVDEHAAVGVRRIEVEVGELSGVEPRLLEQAFTVAQAGTRAAAAEFHVAQVPVSARCEPCGTEHDASPADLSCPRCGNRETRAVAGLDMILKRVQLDLEETSHV